MKSIEPSILMVLVLYKEALCDSETYKSLLQFHPEMAVFIWDNSPRAQEMPDDVSALWHYSHSPTNKGLSYAYNQAANYAQSNDYKWLCLLDQDTHFDHGFVQAILNAVQQHPEMELFCPLHRLSDKSYLSPTRLCMGFPKRSDRKHQGRLVLKHHAIINSGLFVTLSLFKRAGGYNEKVFLDHSDFQFLQRVAQCSPFVFAVNSVCIQHFSNQETDPTKLLERYMLFCTSLKACKKTGIGMTLIYDLTVFKRCLALMIRLRNVRPLQTFYKYYIQSES